MSVVDWCEDIPEKEIIRLALWRNREEHKKAHLKLSKLWYGEPFKPKAWFVDWSIKKKKFTDYNDYTPEFRVCIDEIEKIWGKNIHAWED